MRLFFSLVFLFILGTSVSAQSYTTKKTASKKALKYYMKGKELGRANDNTKAMKEFDKALTEDANFIDALIEKAGIYFNTGKKDQATQTLEKVIELDPYYKPKLLYTLGSMKKKQGKCDEAVPLMEQYLKAPKTHDAIVAKAQKIIDNCDFLANFNNKITAFNPLPMNDMINTASAEYFPSISADGETFFFTRRDRGQEDIYFCMKDGDDWGTPIALRHINTRENEANQSISADGRTIVFTACGRRGDGFGSCDIYISKFVNGHWEPVQNMGAGINSPAWESQPSISADGKMIFFTSRRKGNKGKADIYYSKSNDEGAWSIAKPIKGLVNSTGDEQTPFIHPDGKTLYFKSNGHPGFGGLDIYYSKKQKDGTWGKPVNLGKGINSEADDGSFIVSLDGKTAFFDSARNLKEGEDEKKESSIDIYYMELEKSLRPEPVTYVKARVVDADSKKPIQAKVEFVDLGTQKVHAYNTTDQSGEFLVCLPVGQDYGLNVSKTDYLFHSENFALKDGNPESQPYELTIELKRIPPAIVETKPTTIQQPIKVKPTPPQPIILKNIFFATGSAKLEDRSSNELMKLYQLLQETPKMNIEIRGHTDNVGSDADNMKLSHARSKAVYDYLIGKGISSIRLKYKGYGETQPIDTNDTSDGRQNNRRTEFIILP